MATLRNGRRALLVVDAQVGPLVDGWRRDEVVAAIALAVARARAANAPVLWVQHEDEELPAGSAAWQIVPELIPLPGDVLLGKAYNSSFEETDLETELERLGVSHLVVAGAATGWCIRATAYAALERGYDLTLVADGHTMPDLELPDGSRVVAEAVVRDLNVAFTWLSYPGRQVASISADQLDFH